MPLRLARVEIRYGQSACRSELAGRQEEKAPQVFFTGKPAELLLFKGNPVYTQIPGTSLTYANNTENDVFVSKMDGKFYVLLSGRWFRASKLDGP